MGDKNKKLTIPEIENVLDLYGEYSKKREVQKSRGLNDFNVFNILLNISDEVRLHSRFLQSMLDPHGTHGQGTLFLELFLQECGLLESVDLSSCKVFKEYQFIDLYITDGNRHIIIENKIYAGDQDKQIERYINLIRKENSNEKISEKIIIIYLSLDKDKPEDYSLGCYKYSNDKLIYGNDEYQFLSIHYNEAILRWIKSSKEQVSNITNIYVSLIQYEDVILMLYKKYKEKVMSLNEFMDSREDKISILKSIRNINSEYLELKDNMMFDYFNKIVSELRKKISADKWEVVIDKDKLSRSYGTPLRIQNTEDSKVFLGFEFDSRNYIDGYFGVTRRNGKVDLNLCLENDEVKSLLKNVKKPLSKSTQWWITWGWYEKGDLFDYILEKGDVEQSVKDFVDAFYSIFDSYNEVVLKCNQVLE